MHAQTLIEEVRRLIAIPSDQDCTAIQNYLQERLPFLPWQRQYVDKIVEGQPQFNLYAVFPERPLIINTHVDTVPALGMPAPFTPKVVNGRVYGRGAVDTKGLIAALVVALDTFYRQHQEIPVSIAFTVDEENTSAIGSEMFAQLLTPDHFVLVLEPTGGRIGIRQAGSLEFKWHARGKPQHAALFHRAVHPIRLLVELLHRAETALERPINVLLFQGGWEHYATPREAHLLAEVLVRPGERWETLEETLLTLTHQPPFASHVQYQRVDSENPLDFGHHFATEALSRAYEQALGVPPVFDTVPSWTDAANFVKAGASCVIFGFGDLVRAHSDEEYITVEELTLTAQVLYNLLSILSQSPQRTSTGRKPARR